MEKPRLSELAAAAGALAALALAAALFLPRQGVVPSAPGARLAATSAPPSPSPLAGSQSCRSCHAVFFQKWSTSFHGLAMQPHTGDFARDRLTPQEKPIAIGSRRYRAIVGTGADHVEETGPEGRKTHAIVQVLGGKNVCYFLTPLDRGLLQVLPVAYDVNRREWFATAASAVRHFEGVTNEELDWTDRAYTFNTSCFSCHVSQLATNYEPATDSYRTVWAEPGVSCETCHGPAAEHVKAFEGLAPGVLPKDWKIVSVKALSKEQRTDLCASCHAKASPLWTAFRPGDRFFDHFDLTTLESPDYHPDGRDLGENYTLTSCPAAAAERYGKAVALRPDHVASLVNLSMAEARRGRMAEAETALRGAIRVQPHEAAAHFNLGLLLASRCSRLGPEHRFVTGFVLTLLRLETRLTRGAQPQDGEDRE
jgi:hypothetical protein